MEKYQTLKIEANEDFGDKWRTQDHFATCAQALNQKLNPIRDMLGKEYPPTHLEISLSLSARENETLSITAQFQNCQYWAAPMTFIHNRMFENIVTLLKPIWDDPTSSAIIQFKAEIQAKWEE